MQVRYSSLSSREWTRQSPPPSILMDLSPQLISPKLLVLGKKDRNTIVVAVLHLMVEMKVEEDQVTVVEEGVEENFQAIVFSANCVKSRVIRLKGAGTDSSKVFLHHRLSNNDHNSPYMANHNHLFWPTSYCQHGSSSE